MSPLAVREMLANAGLSSCADGILNCGVTSPDDLANLSDDDVKGLALNRIQERKLSALIEAQKNESRTRLGSTQEVPAATHAAEAPAAANTVAGSFGSGTLEATDLMGLGMEVDASVSASSLDFPHTIGPFTMGTANLCGAFNAFYRQHNFIPRPDPRSDENSMSGFDPAVVGLGRGDIIFCQLSPLHEITLDTEAMEAANIPTRSTHFAWAYPIVQPPDAPVNFAESSEGAFLKFGGYMYFDARMEIVGTNAICPVPLGTPGLMFARPHILAQGAAETLTRQGRFQEITLETFNQKGATHFAWIRPGEFADAVACPDGAFAYKFSVGPPKYFPVVGKPAYTVDLFHESLDNNEAWVVVRNATRQPRVEELVIFDRTKSLRENAEAATTPIPVEEPVARISVKKDWSPDLELTYEDWARTSDQGSIVDPWIVCIER